MAIFAHVCVCALLWLCDCAPVVLRFDGVLLVGTNAVPVARMEAIIRSSGVDRRRVLVQAGYQFFATAPEMFDLIDGVFLVRWVCSPAVHRLLTPHPRTHAPAERHDVHGWSTATSR